MHKFPQQSSHYLICSTAMCSEFCRIIYVFQLRNSRDEFADLFLCPWNNTSIHVSLRWLLGKNFIMMTNVHFWVHWKQHQTWLKEEISYNQCVLQTSLTFCAIPQWHHMLRMGSLWVDFHSCLLIPVIFTCDNFLGKPKTTP